jgi:hypothetical protein
MYFYAYLPYLVLESNVVVCSILDNSLKFRYKKTLSNDRG